MAIKFTRHISNVIETPTTVTFELVLRDGEDRHTYGGKTITITKPLTDAKVRTSIQAAVTELSGAKGQGEGLVRSLARQMDDEER